MKCRPRYMLQVLAAGHNVNPRIVGTAAMPRMAMLE